MAFPLDCSSQFRIFFCRPESAILTASRTHAELKPLPPLQAAQHSRARPPVVACCARAVLVLALRSSACDCTCRRRMKFAAPFAAFSLAVSSCFNSQFDSCRSVRLQAPGQARARRGEDTRRHDKARQGKASGGSITSLPVTRIQTDRSVDGWGQELASQRGPTVCRPVVSRAPQRLCAGPNSAPVLGGQHRQSPPGRAELELLW
jgi:hypothetical protein